MNRFYAIFKLRVKKSFRLCGLYYIILLYYKEGGVAIETNQSLYYVEV
jgi:hypothetical protein